MSKQTTTELIRAALGHLSPNVPRIEWARVGMAIKSEYPGDDGLAIFDEWSMRGESYDAKGVRSTWRSIKPSGGVTIATLIHEAQANGFELPTQSSDAPKPSPEHIAALAAQKKAAAQRERERTEAAHLATAAQTMKRWKAAQDAPPEGAATYPARKGVQAHGLRFEADGTALVPLRDGDIATGKLWNVQTLAPRKVEGQPDKLFLKGGRKAGLWHMLGMPDLEQKQPLPVTESAQIATIFMAEGYATAASVHEATGLPVACAFDAGNLLAVAKALRALHPSALLVMAGDDDHETQAATGRNAGREAADKAAKAVKGLAVFPAELQAAESDWNDLHVRLGLDVVREQLMNAIESAARKGDSLSPFAEHAQAIDAHAQAGKAPYEDKRFSVSESGVWFTGLDADGKPKSPLKLCSPLHVTAGTRDFEGNGFGCLLEFDDPLGHRKAWPMPARMLSGDGNEYRSVLLSMGLRVEPGSAVKNLLSTYIQSRQPTAWAHCTDRAGWHKITNNSEGKAVYVQPRHTFGDSPEHRVIFQSDSPMENTFRSAGTLDQWRDKVAALCVGNSRLAFAMSCAFAGMAMRWLKSESGGFHLRGDSSSGKTTALRVAASVFGGDSYMQRWRATDNAIEAIAAQHCDALLVLDELAQVDPKQAGEIAYMLGNGQGKARANRSAMPKPLLRWNLLFLSAGEVGLAQHVAESGKRVRAGQEVRMVDMAADAGAGYGAFERIHDNASPADFSSAITKACSRWHGTAAPAFIEHLIAHQEGLAASLGAAVDTVAAQMIPEAASGQAQRVGRRFALVAAAGELATQAGITGWPAGEATRAARVCFESWLSTRGGLGNLEQGQMLAQVRNFLQLHGAGRFTWWHRAADDHAPNTLSRAGYKRIMGEDGKPVRNNAEHQREYGERITDTDAQGVSVEYFIFPEVFDKEVCQGFDPLAVKRLLRDAEHLHSESDTRFDRKERLPGIGMARVIKIKPSIFEGDAE
jgi:putative DNA primase/helicase